ncbi:MAG: SIR2 family protein [Planctomycetales bacterium]|nr:SIR2 family protein [Planctomycetales bacterium]
MPSPNPPTNDVHFDPLTKSVRLGRCVAVIGAGVSADDYPLWSELIEILKERCELKPDDICSTDPLDVAEAAKSKNAHVYYTVLGEIFARRETSKTASRYHSLARIPFASYVTLNFDPLLVDILSLHKNVHWSEYPWLSPENHNGKEVFHAHGRIQPGVDASLAKIVLTRSEFDEAYNPHTQRLHSFWQSTFLDHVVCFIGCNPSEPNIRRLLSSCKAFRSRVISITAPWRPRWYLLWDDLSDPPRDLQEDCEIYPVQYCRGISSFAGLDDVLHYWAGRQSPKLRLPGTTRSLLSTDGEPDHD